MNMWAAITITVVACVLINALRDVTIAKIKFADVKTNTKKK